MCALSRTYVNLHRQATYVNPIIAIFIGPSSAGGELLTGTLLFGLLKSLQFMRAEAFIRTMAGILACILAAGIVQIWWRNRWSSIFLLSLLSLSSIVLSIRTSVGWDEFFINLKHSVNLAGHGIFSANARESIEATVDFAPFALAGILSRLLAVSAADIAIVIGLSGNVLLIVGASLIARGATGSALAGGTAAAVMSVLPPVVLVGATGFMATLFSGIILIAGYYFFVQRGRGVFRAFALLGLLPLVRTEGILLGGLLLAGTFAIGLQRWIKLGHPKRHLRRALLIMTLRTGVLLLPLMTLSLWRLWMFGSIVPIPMIFKNTGFDPSYVKVGLGQLSTLVFQHRLHVLLILVGPILVWFVARLGYRAALYVGATSALSIAYFSGGGDWFPVSWARYAMPFVVLIITLAVSAIFAFSVVIAPKRLAGACALSMVFLVGAAMVASSQKNVFTDFPAEIAPSYNRWGRIENLGRFGNFLKGTTPTSARIASPEMATIMYYADRDLVDLLGIASPEIARAKLDPFGPGNILHRRRAPNVLDFRRPEIVALYEMSFPIPPNFHRGDRQAVEEFLQKAAFNQSMVDIAYYRVGSYEHLLRLGYKPYIVVEPDIIFVYWVHDIAAAEHRRLLLAAGYQQNGTSRFRYRVSPHVAQHFYAGIPTVEVSHSRPTPGLKQDFPILAPPATSGHWGRPGMPNVVPRPAWVGDIYGSWSGDDRHTGELTIGPFEVAAGSVISIPVVRGPGKQGQRVSVIDVVSGMTIAETNADDLPPHEWAIARFKVTAINRPRLVLLKVQDHGGSWGEWVAVGTPFIEQ